MGQRESGSRRASKKTRLREILASRGSAPIDREAWSELLRELAPINDSKLRSLVHKEPGAVAIQPLDGVRQSTLEEVETSLRELGVCYEDAMSTGDRQLAGECRRVVIEAKDHARWASRNPRSDESKRSLKTEMLKWMLVWLENPPVFPVWVELRKRNLGESAVTE